MPSKLTTGEMKAETANDFSIEMVGRQCALSTYKKIKKIEPFDISGEFIAYASPDSTYAVTRKLIEKAKKEIIIGIYDFSAPYIKELVLNAMQRGVKVSLMLDVDSDKERKLAVELERFGCKTVDAPSCANKEVSYFPSSHEKVIVIDGTWTLVQSGNYSTNSIPFNEIDGGDPDNFVKGNRDMGVAVNSKPLASFFAKVLKSDMKLALSQDSIESIAAKSISSLPILVEAAPAKIPVKLFASKSIKPTGKIKVTPVLTPDNYLDVIVDLLKSAKKSIYIENQYIRGKQANIAMLLGAIKIAKQKNPKLDVKIILGKLFSQKDYTAEVANVALIKKEYGLSLNKNIRYIDTTRFVHCHNKLIVVDGHRTLVSSQNWSNTGVGTNREAGLLMESNKLAVYYSEIFESDWKTAFTKVPKVGKATVSAETVKRGNYIEVEPADYQEV